MDTVSVDVITFVTHLSRTTTPCLGSLGEIGARMRRPSHNDFKKKKKRRRRLAKMPTVKC